jgi:glycosyltransferase involved in cell wall biosynthesis
MHPPTIAAIIPVFNRPRAVCEAMDSVLAQTLAPTMLIVVDDGSTDDTPAAIDRWIAAHQPPFPTRLIRQSNAGASAARNRGAQEAGPVDLLAFLDSDDLWPADYLHRTSAVMTAQPTAAGVSIDQLCLESSGDRKHVRISAEPALSVARLFRDGPPGTPNSVIRGEHFRAVGGYDVTQMCGEDYQLILRLALRGPWLTATGDPVTVRYNTADAREKTGQLSRRYADRRYRLACILDDFIQRDGGREAIDEPIWRRRLGRVWYTAGRQAAKAGQIEQARLCFERAASHWPWHLRAQLRRIIGR